MTGLLGRTGSGGPASAGVGSDHASVGRPVLDGPSDYLLAAVLVLVVLITVGVWSTGQTAALLTGHGWPAVPVTAGLGIAGRLPHHLSDPAAAWPATARPLLPGLAGMVVAAVVNLLALTGLAILAARWRGRGRRRRGFASPAQIHAALSPAAARATATRIRPGLAATQTQAQIPAAGGLRASIAAAARTLARPHRIAVEDVAVAAGRTDPGVHSTSAAVAIGLENSVLVLAAPRQGKTSQVVIPWVTDWPGPAVVTSVRPDVALATLELRRGRGPVAVMDLTGNGWPDPLTWSPTTGCESFDAARRRADLLVTVGKTSGNGIGADSTNAAFFGTSATNLLAGWLHAAALTNRTMADVLDWALDERKNDPIRLLRDLDVPLADIAQVLDARDPEVTARVLRQRQESLAAQIADAERVLQQLRQVSLAPEAGTPVRVVELPHRHALAVRAEIELEQCPEFFGEAFPRLAAAAGRFGAEVAGPSGATYPVQATDGPQTVTAFLPVRSPVQPGDGVVLVDLPRATAGLLTHRGGYDTIDNPYLQLGAWVGYHARSSGLPVEEHYVVSYGDVEEPADFRTDIHWPIVGHLTEEKK